MNPPFTGGTLATATSPTVVHPGILGSDLREQVDFDDTTALVALAHSAPVYLVLALSEASATSSQGCHTRATVGSMNSLPRGFEVADPRAGWGPGLQRPSYLK